MIGGAGSRPRSCTSALGPTHVYLHHRLQQAASSPHPAVPCPRKPSPLRPMISVLSPIPTPFSPSALEHDWAIIRIHLSVESSPFPSKTLLPPPSRIPRSRPTTGWGESFSFRACVRESDLWNRDCNISESRPCRVAATYRVCI
jgi:hypothetical protein